MLTQRVLDSGSYVREAKGVLGVCSAGVAYGDADLSNPRKSFEHQCLVPVVEGLITSDEKRGRLLPVKDRTHPTRNFLGPVFNSPGGGDAHVPMLRWGEQLI